MSFRSHRRRVAPVATLALACVALAASTASATTPGRNGRIAFGAYSGFGDYDVWTVVSNDASELALTTSTADDQGPSWSPDGTKIVFSSARTGSGDIYVMNSDGTGQTLLFGSTAQEVHPAWSPDGSRIAYVRIASGTRQIWIANADGSNPTALTTGPDGSFNPNWSPDGTHLVYTRNTPTAGIWTMNADGSGQTLIFPSTVFRDPTYSPDGTKIVCVCGPAPDVATMNADGSNFTALTSDGAAWAATWSPDGTKIAWFKTTSDWNVWAMNPDGSNQTQLTTNLHTATGMSWQTLPNAPTATTGPASGVTMSAATLAGTVNPATRAYGTTYHFEYGTTTGYGTSTPNQSLSGDTSNHAVSAGLSSLAAGTTYHYRLVATNGAGTTNGSDQTFTTVAAPVVTPPVTTPPSSTPPVITPPVITTPSITDLTPGVRCARRVTVTDPVEGQTGAWFKYSLSEAASVSYTLQRQVGSRAYRRCPKASSAAAAEFRRVWFTTLAQAAGPHAITIGSVRYHAKDRAVATAASAAKVRLSPGVYRVVLVATNQAGRSSAPAYAYFRVLRAVKPGGH